MKKYLIFDIGGTFIKWAIVNQNHEIIQNYKFAFDGKKLGAKKLLEEIGKKVIEIESNWKIDAIGISTAGIINPKTTQIMSDAANIKNYNGIILKNEIKKFTNTKIFVENDANAAVIGESIEKNVKKYKNLLLITLGTDIGGGIILNNKIYRGYSGIAGEIGYQIIDNKRWGSYFSAKGLIKLVKEFNNRELTTYEILNSSDPNVIDTLNYWYEGIAKGIANMLLIMNFEAIIIGGGISESTFFDIKKIQKNIDIYLVEPKFKESYKIFKATKGNSAAIIGMAELINRKNGW